MHALISGQAGLAVFIEGNCASVVASADPGVTAEYPLSSLYLLLGGATDVVECPSISRKEALSKLHVAANSELAFHLALIMLDCEEDAETRQIAVEDLDEELADEAVHESVANRLCSVPLPASADPEALDEVARRHANVAALLDEVVQLQPALRRYHRAWQELPASLFTGPRTRDQFEARMASRGLLRLLAKAGDDPSSFGLAQYECYQALAGLPGERQVLSAWLADFLPEGHGEPTSLRPEGRGPGDVGEAETPRQHREPMSPQASHETHEKVVSQQKAIVDALRSGHFARARKIIDQLVQFQLGHGGSGFAAKSLCNLAQEAKNVHAHSLQLELATRAVAVAPSDGWACGQVADAYCCLQQYGEALKWFEEAAGLGQGAFACTGRARILRQQGLLEEAARLCRQACRTYPEEVSPWLHLAEIQRELESFDDALATYEQAVALFPGERFAHCGRAAVLADLGRLEDAVSGYDHHLEGHPGDVVAHAGRAQVLKELGRLEEALASYQRAVEVFPEEPVPRCGRAEVLKEMGRLEEALRAYEEAVALFAYEPVPWNGRAEVYREMGQLDTALRSYDEAVSRFPDDVRTLGGRANLLKQMGRLEEALQAYDHIVASFPFDEFAQRGRADLLKELGNLEGAVAAYDQVIARSPHSHGAAYAKAAVLVVMGRYSDAEALLLTTVPRTRDEWVAYHIKGMILLKTGRVEDAVKHFEEGVAALPFVRRRRCFENALAVAAMRQERFTEAARHLAAEPEPLSDVIRLHVLGALDRAHEAQEAYRRLAAYCPPTLATLRDELAARYSLVPGEPRFDWKWVFEQECRGILLLAA